MWRSADAVIAISFAVRDWLIEQMSLPAGLIRTIHYGIEADEFASKEVEDVRAHAMVGSIGRLEGRKGHDCLIRAMPTVLREVPNAQLRIAGNDPWGYGVTLERLISSLGLEGCVQLVGFRDDVKTFLEEIDVFAFASRSEGFGQVVIEAMAAGRPVVVSRVTPLTEIVVDGETGYVAPGDVPEAFGQAMARLLTNPDEARRMGRRGRARVRESFSARRMAAATYDVYQALAR
jgi:glycosyltransferase involved in cell wall biosynthesis